MKNTDKCIKQIQKKRLQCRTTHGEKCTCTKLYLYVICDLYYTETSFYSNLNSGFLGLTCDHSAKGNMIYCLLVCYIVTKILSLLRRDGIAVRGRGSAAATGNSWVLSLHSSTL